MDFRERFADTGGLVELTADAPNMMCRSETLCEIHLKGEFIITSLHNVV